MVSTELLRRYPLFARQSYYMLKEIAMLSEEVELEAGEWLFQEEEEATRFYMILEGSLSLTLYLFLNGHGRHIEATGPLTPGEILGWSALIKPHFYKLGAQAEEKTRLLAIDAVSLRELLDDNPGFGYFFLKNVAEVLGERLTSTCIQLLSIVLDPSGRPLTSKVA